MSLYKEWTNLADNQTQATFKEFWKEYSEAETKIYTDILENYDKGYKGTIDELSAKYDVRPIIFMGFLDGIQTSLNEEFELKDLDGESEIDLDIDFEKLYFNMYKADADYLYSLPQWENVLGEEKMAEVYKSYKRSKTVVKGEKIGRNDPCPCGSGKKYKHCCGRA